MTSLERIYTGMYGKNNSNGITLVLKGVMFKKRNDETVTVTEEQLDALIKGITPAQEYAPNEPAVTVKGEGGNRMKLAPMELKLIKRWYNEKKGRGQ